MDLKNGAHKDQNGHVQMLVFILGNCGEFLHVVTVLLEYLADCSIRVSQSCIIFVGVGDTCPLCHPLGE